MARPRGPDRVERAEAAAAQAVAAGLVPPPELLRGLVHVIDHRTSDVCLDLAARGQVVATDEPWDTLLGEQMNPPFHEHCRTIVVPVIPGELEPQGVTVRDAEAEQRAREIDDESRETRRPSRPERRRRKRDVRRRVREEERRRREEQRQRRGRQQQGFGAAAAPSEPPNGRQTRDPLDVRPPVRPRHTTLREWLPLAAEVNRAHDPLSGDDPAMRVILRRQRWTGPPSVVPSGRLVWPLVAYLAFRGLAAGAEPAEVYAEQLRRGALVLGLGVAGVGLYFALAEPAAEQYAGADGVVVRSGLAPEARVIDVDDLTRARLAALSALSDREAAALRVIASDPGRLAAALGYDAVRFPDGTLLVVNRTALIVEEP